MIPHSLRDGLKIVPAITRIERRGRRAQRIQILVLAGFDGEWPDLKTAVAGFEDRRPLDLCSGPNSRRR
jgi:hypothetical protein